MYFCGIRPSLIFFDRGTWRHVCNTHTCTQKISYFHVFLEKSHLSLPARGKKYFFGKKIPSFQIMQGCSGATLFEKTIFSESLKKISYFHVFFWERSSFIFRLRCKIIFSGKRNIIFPDNTRKIIFQRDFFGKTIFSGCLEKENMVFRAVYVRYLMGLECASGLFKWHFSCSYERRK